MNYEISRIDLGQLDIVRQAQGFAITPRITPYQPAADIWLEEDGTRHIVLALHGVRPADLSLTLEQRILTVTGTQSLPDLEGRRWIARSYRLGQAIRRFRLGEELDEQSIEAHYRNGLLEITIKPRASDQARKIPIKIR